MSEYYGSSSGSGSANNLHHHQDASVSTGFNQPLMFSDSAGQLLQKMADSFEDKNRRRNRFNQKTSSSYNQDHYIEPKPDPVLWFPGGDADCGSNAQTNSDISTFSIIALLFSIFNIIDLLVSNANNNNNRNNINDNAQNVNVNSNTESNANPGQSAANQVMMVPPGVGRRRRETGEEHCKRFIGHEVREKHFRLVLETSNCSESDHSDIKTTWYPLNNVTSIDNIHDEVLLGVTMVKNAWHLLVTMNESDPCHVLNFCELGYNGGVWGTMSEVVVEIAGLALSRWMALNVQEENNYSQSLRKGLQLGRSYNLNHQPRAQCSQVFNSLCSVSTWNNFVLEAKKLRK